MGSTWPVQDAKARYSEMLETSVSEGPKIASKRGVEAAVLTPIKEWHQLQKRARPERKELLLGPEGRTDMLTPPRRRQRRRPSPSFE